MGMGQATLLTCCVTGTQPAPSLCSATAHPSLQWGLSASHFHSLCKPCGVGQLAHTDGRNVSSWHITGLCAGEAQSHCALPVHSMRRNTSAPVPAAQGCNCLVPVDAAVAALPSPEPGWPLGALWQTG